jgi:glutamate synthase domain-containing protein 3
MAELNCEGRTVREINAEIRLRLAEGESEIIVRAPGARHNLGVALLREGKVVFDGSVGYYCAGLIDGAAVEVKGSAGWGLGESMLSGQVVVHGNAGNGAGAAIRGGTLVIHGDSGARTGVSMKGGLVLVGGNCGYMSGFMAQKGALVVCGDTGEAFGDSMYETVCYVGGRIADLGTDALVSEPSAEDIAFLDAALSEHLPAEVRAGKPAAKAFKKVVAGRKLWNFDRTEWKVWQEAL